MYHLGRKYDRHTHTFQESPVRKAYQLIYNEMKRKHYRDDSYSMDIRRKGPQELTHLIKMATNTRYAARHKLTAPENKLIDELIAAVQRAPARTRMARKVESEMMKFAPELVERSMDPVEMLRRAGVANAERVIEVAQQLRQGKQVSAKTRRMVNFHVAKALADKVRYMAKNVADEYKVKLTAMTERLWKPLLREIKGVRKINRFGDAEKALVQKGVMNPYEVMRVVKLWRRNPRIQTTNSQDPWAVRLAESIYYTMQDDERKGKVRYADDMIDMTPEQLKMATRNLDRIGVMARFKGKIEGANGGRVLYLAQATLRRMAIKGATTGKVEVVSTDEKAVTVANIIIQEVTRRHNASLYPLNLKRLNRKQLMELSRIVSRRTGATINLASNKYDGPAKRGVQIAQTILGRMRRGMKTGLRVKDYASSRSRAGSVAEVLISEVVARHRASRKTYPLDLERWDKRQLAELMRVVRRRHKELRRIEVPQSTRVARKGLGHRKGYGVMVRMVPTEYGKGIIMDGRELVQQGGRVFRIVTPIKFDPRQKYTRVRKYLVGNHKFTVQEMNKQGKWRTVGAGKLLAAGAKTQRISIITLKNKVEL